MKKENQISEKHYYAVELPVKGFNIKELTEFIVLLGGQIAMTDCDTMMVKHEDETIILALVRLKMKREKES